MQNEQKIDIIPYQHSDLEAIETIHDRARKIELGYARLEKAFIPFKIAAEREHFFDYDGIFVAEADGTTAGFAACSKKELAWLYVSPDFMRRGVGRALASYALDKFPEIKYVEVLFGNCPAKALYESLGFEVT